MPVHRFQVAVGADTAFPKDRIVNTLHFTSIGSSAFDDVDYTNMCNDIADVWDTKLSLGGRELRVTAYDVGTPPQYPKKMIVRREGVVTPIASNRELACCLSYYNERSNPRKRGRLFIPAYFSGATTSISRPSVTIQTKLLDLGTALAAIGGIDIAWTVYSPTTNQAHEVLGAWVDDAWDVVRSRGLAPTTRAERTF